MTPLSFHIHNFGCRATQADGAALEHDLLSRGWLPAPDPAQADLLVFNTCTVTAAADEDARRAVRHAHRDHPQAQILVTGCYAQRAPKEVAALPGVRWVVGNSHKPLIGEIIVDGVDGPQVLVGDISQQLTFTSLPVLGAAEDRSRPNLKIQDGCNFRCSFCIIPSVRGRSRSMPPEQVIRQVQGLAAAGYPEVVLSGINLGRYGRDLVRINDAPGLTLTTMLRRLLEETDVRRLRLSSVEPMDFSDPLLELMAGSDRMAQHIHAPLQSGSARILRAMHRRYRPEQYEERIRRAHALMPDAAFGADVMVGFPGETEDDFAATRGLIESLPFTYLHVFTYSRREGTAAAALPDQVHRGVTRERNRVLRELAAQKNLEFRKRHVGRTLSVVTLEDGSALSGNYLRLKIEGATPPARQIMPMHVLSPETAGPV